MKLKATADASGKPFFGEMSSVNPVVFLPGAVAEKQEALATEFVSSVLLGTGQFCTNPGLIFMLAGAQTETFIQSTVEKMKAAPVGTLFSELGRRSLLEAIETIRTAGAELLAGGAESGGPGFRVENTLLRATVEQFLAKPREMQTEAFGNSALIVVAESLKELKAALETLDGNLTGCVYSAAGGSDDAAYDEIAPILRPRVGRLINDKMPTGVAVSPAMNHGGPFPATSSPHFTAVGVPASLMRFTQLESFDNVRPHRLPACLQNKNPTGKMQRYIDGRWTSDDVS